MKPFEINQLNRLCREQTREFHPVFGTPITQHFGDTPDPGTSTEFASADHQHGLEELPEDTVDSLDRFALVFNDFLINSVASNEFESWGTISNTTIRDVPGRIGGFGTIDATTGTGANTGAGVVLTQVLSATITTSQNTYVPRLRRFEARVLPVLLVTDLPSIRCVVGGFRAGTHQRLDLLTDGVYFELDTDVTGAGTWHCKIREGSVDMFDQDSFLSPSGDGSSNYFDHFRIDYDGTTTSFYMGTPDDTGELTWGLIASTQTALPGASNLVCGWGAGVMTEAVVGAGKTMVVDNILFAGLRVAL